MNKQTTDFYLIYLVGNEVWTDRSVHRNQGLGLGVWERRVGLYWGLGFKKKFFNEINRGNFFSMKSALEIVFEFFVMKTALKNFSNFSKKINIQTTHRSVQNFLGLEIGGSDLGFGFRDFRGVGFRRVAISPISARLIYQLQLTTHLSFY